MSDDPRPDESDETERTRADDEVDDEYHGPDPEEDAKGDADAEDQGT